MIRVIIDTNIALSGFLSFTSPERMIVNYAMQKKIQLIGCQETYDEFEEKIINNERFKKVADDLMFPKDKLLMGYKTYVSITEVDEDLKSQKYCLADPDDDIFIQLAISSNTKIIISNDKHLRNLKKVNDVRIVKPDKFLEILRSNGL